MYHRLIYFGGNPSTGIQWLSFFLKLPPGSGSSDSLAPVAAANPLVATDHARKMRRNARGEYSHSTQGQDMMEERLDLLLRQFGKSKIVSIQSWRRPSLFAQLIFLKPLCVWRQRDWVLEFSSAKDYVELGHIFLVPPELGEFCKYFQGKKSCSEEN